MVHRDCTLLKCLTPKVKSPTIHAHVMKIDPGLRYQLLFSQYNSGKKTQDTEVIQKYLTTLRIHAVTVLHVTLLQPSISSVSSER